MRSKLNGCALGLAALPLVLNSASVASAPATDPLRISLQGGRPAASAVVVPSTYEQHRALRVRKAVEKRVGVPEEMGRRAALRVRSPKGVRTVRASRLGAHDIPAAALRAYKRSARILSAVSPRCQLSWTLLAGIGRVESDHGRYAGARLGTDGVSRPLILGLPLNGVGPVAAIRDSDNGRLDKDAKWDRAVGPMQFIPTTWDAVGVDGDGDGTRSPSDIDDAALAAAVYLCAGSVGVDARKAMRGALHRYNHSEEYVALVMAYEREYRTGDFKVTDRRPPGPRAVAPLSPALKAVVIRTAKTAQKAGAKTKGISGKAKRPDKNTPDRADHDKPGEDKPDSDKPASDQPEESEGENGGENADTDQSDDDGSGDGGGGDNNGGDNNGGAGDNNGNDGNGGGGDGDGNGDDGSNGGGGDGDGGSTPPDPEPDPEPEPEPIYDFEPLVETGVLEAGDDGFYLNGLLLDVGDEEMLATFAVTDFDADGLIEDNYTELTGLVGAEVTLLVNPLETGYVLYTITVTIEDVLVEHIYRLPDGTLPLPEE